MKTLLMIALFAPVSAFAAGIFPIADDTELGSPALFTELEVSSVLAPDSVSFTAGGDGLAVETFWNMNGDTVAVRELPWRLNGAAPGNDGRFSCTNGATVKLTATLDNTRYRVHRTSSVYQFSFSTKCGGTARVRFEQSTSAGQVAGIWHVATEGKRKLAAEVGLDFWQAKISFKFPGSGNYYTNNTVTLTRGDHWDVVAHEMGHAIYDQARLGRFGGGAHSIRGCYNGALALSEGWASYFGAWVFVDRAARDPRFAFLAGGNIPFEHVASNVCQGHTNELRATAFFWDLYDRNEDRERAGDSFARAFSALRNKLVADSAAAASELVRAGFSATDVNAAWEVSFGTDRPSR